MVVRNIMGFGLAAVGSVALVSSVFGGEKLKLYGRTGERIIEEKLDAACGVGTKLELLKTNVRELDSEVARLERDAIARRVELDAAQSRVGELESAIAHQKEILARAADLLDRNCTSYEIAGTCYPRESVEADARAKLEACRTAERVLEDEKKVVAVKARTLELARAHLERARTRRGELAQAVRSLEARIAEQQAKRALAEALDAQPLSTEVQGELAKAERLAKEVQSKLEIEERLLDERLAQKNGPTGQIEYEPSRPVETADVSRAIRAHLAGPPQTAEPRTSPERARTPVPPEPAEVH
jgi:outer membrane murein-binding lipoprotein Lpp